MIYEVLAVILLIFFLLIAGFLLVPLQVFVQFSKKGPSIKGDFKVKWLRLTMIHRIVPTAERKREATKSERPKISDVISVLRDSFPQLTHIFNAVRRSITFKMLSCHMKVGLDNPADTAVLYGYMWALFSILDVDSRLSFTLEPDFQEIRFDGEILAKANVRLLRIVIAFVVAYTKKPFRRLFREIRKMGT